MKDHASPERACDRMSAQEFSAFIGPHQRLADDAALAALVKDRISRLKAGGMWRDLRGFTGGNATYNADLDDWEYPPIPQGEIDLWCADLAATRAASDASYARVNGSVLPATDPGDLPCQECRGTGDAYYDAGFSSGRAICACPACRGTGWRK